MRNFYNYLNNVRVYDFDRFKKEIIPIRPDFFDYMNNQNLNNQNKLNNVNNLNNLNSPKSNLKGYENVNGRQILNKALPSSIKKSRSKESFEK